MDTFTCPLPPKKHAETYTHIQAHAQKSRIRTVTNHLYFVLKVCQSFSPMTTLTAMARSISTPTIIWQPHQKQLKCILKLTNTLPIKSDMGIAFTEFGAGTQQDPTPKALARM